MPLWLALLGLGLVLVLVNIDSRPSAPPRQATQSDAASRTTNAIATAGVPHTPSTPKPRPSAPNQRADFELRPFAVATESAAHQWTREDGRDTNVIQRLAHNELEYQRLVEENARIQRRQLVYRKDSAAALLQRARASGAPVTQLTLPGFDGQEFQITVDRADLATSQQSGTFTGRLADQPSSLVTVAFKFGREAFTILAPDAGLFLQGHPREPGELIITSFDPATYSDLPGGEPIHTSQK